MQEIKSLYQRRNPNVNITYNFGPPWYKQIEQERRLMCFLCRNQTNGCFAAKNLIPETRRNLLNNRLLNYAQPALTSFRNLTGSEVRRIAIGNRSVPAGICSGTPDKFENF